MLVRVKVGIFGMVVLTDTTGHKMDKQWRMMGFVGEGWLRPVPLGTRIDLCLPHSPPAALRGPVRRSNRLVLLNRMRFRRSCVSQQPAGEAVPPKEAGIIV